MVEITSNLEKIIDDLESEIRITLTATIVREDILDRGKAVKARIQSLIHERAIQETEGTGLADSIEGDLSPLDDDAWIVTIYTTLPHAIWFEEGTGIYGNHRMPIVPKFAKKMIFIPYGKTSRVMAARVSGQPGQHVFRDGLAAFD